MPVLMTNYSPNAFSGENSKADEYPMDVIPKMRSKLFEYNSGAV